MPPGLVYFFLIIPDFDRYTQTFKPIFKKCHSFSNNYLSDCEIHKHINITKNLERITHSRFLMELEDGFEPPTC